MNSFLIFLILDNKEENVFENEDNLIIIDKNFKFDNELISILENKFIENFFEKIRKIPKIDENLFTETEIKEDFDKSFSRLSSFNEKKLSNVYDSKLMKIRGDYCLIFGCIKDSLRYYNISLKILKNNNKLNKQNEILVSLIYESIASNYFKLLINNKNNNGEITKNENINKFIKESLKINKKYNNFEKLYENLWKFLEYLSFIKDSNLFIEHFLDLRIIILKVNFDPRIFLYLGDLANNCGLKRISICCLFEVF